MATVPRQRRPREIEYPTTDKKPMAEADLHRKDMVDTFSHGMLVPPLGNAACPKCVIHVSAQVCYPSLRSVHQNWARGRE